MDQGLRLGTTMLYKQTAFARYAVKALEATDLQKQTRSGVQLISRTEKVIMSFHGLQRMHQFTFLDNCLPRIQICLRGKKVQIIFGPVAQVYDTKNKIARTKYRFQALDTTYFACIFLNYFLGEGSGFKNKAVGTGKVSVQDVTSTAHVRMHPWL